MNESRSTSLGQLAAAEFTRPAVVDLADAEAVVLDYATIDTVAVWHNSTVSEFPATTLVTPTSDPERWQIAVRRALLGLNHQRTQTLAACATEAAAQAAMLQQIRAYAVRQHRNGVICRNGLNDFLGHFELGTYEPHFQVRFAIAGSYEVFSEDAAAARETALTTLRPRTTGICGLDRASVTFEITATDVTVVTVGTSSRLHVAYQICGTGKIDSSNVVHSRNDAEAVLEPDIAGVTGLVTDSAQFHLEVDLDEVE